MRANSIKTIIRNNKNTFDHINNLIESSKIRKRLSIKDKIKLANCNNYNSQNKEKENKNENRLLNKQFTMKDNENYIEYELSSNKIINKSHLRARSEIKYSEEERKSKLNSGYIYYSDDETNTLRAHDYINNRYKSKIELYTTYMQESIIMTKTILKIKAKLNKYHMTKKDQENKEKMIDRYNQERLSYKAHQLNKTINLKKEKKIFQIGDMMFNWINKLNLLNNNTLTNRTKRTSNVELKEVDLFYNNHEASVNPILNNMNRVQNIYFQLSYGVEKFYPDLFSLNPFKIINNDNKLYDMRSLFELFCQFKVLMKLCVVLNKTIDFLKKGLKFNAFYSLIPEVWNESKSFAKSIFHIFNKNRNGYLNFDEFLDGISRIRGKDVKNKIDIFMKIIDTDGNGKLSYEEVYDLSINSLNRVVGDDKNSIEMKESLAKLFADMIFNFCGVEVEDEIKLPIIKEKILFGGPEADYLEMFCCAGRDNTE